MNNLINLSLSRALSLLSLTYSHSWLAIICLFRLFMLSLTRCLRPGASKQWWKSRHNRHHAKVNVINKDPDIDVTQPLFIFGAPMVKYNRVWGALPYQAYYWDILGPPM